MTELKTHTNIHIPYSSHKHGFSAYFPNSRSALQVRWATSLATAEACVEERTMFIPTKSRFKLIQSVRGGKDKRGSGSYGAFCKFLDEDQANLENFIRAQTSHHCKPRAFIEAWWAELQVAATQTFRNWCKTLLLALLARHFGCEQLLQLRPDRAWLVLDNLQCHVNPICRKCHRKALVLLYWYQFHSTWPYQRYRWFP